MIHICYSKSVQEPNLIGRNYFANSIEEAINEFRKDHKNEIILYAKIQHTENN